MYFHSFYFLKQIYIFLNLAIIFRVKTQLNSETQNHPCKHSSRSQRQIILRVFNLQPVLKCHLTGLDGFSPPPSWEWRAGRAADDRGLPSLLTCPDSAMSTPLSSLRVCPLSDSWDRCCYFTDMLDFNKVEFSTLALASAKYHLYIAL
uniref:Uncharacterized protein n=1 Tax=Xiphophorus maculatus TaxID=8083 RepID=A0A3B5QRW6_XIPMA